MNETNKPAWKQRAGRMSCAVWFNTVKTSNGEIELPSIVLERAYKSKDGTWSSTNRLNLEDIGRARLLLGEAYRFLVMNEEPSGNGDQ